MACRVSRQAVRSQGHAPVGWQGFVTSLATWVAECRASASAGTGVIQLIDASLAW